MLLTLMVHWPEVVIWLHLTSTGQAGPVICMPGAEKDGDIW